MKMVFVSYSTLNKSNVGLFRKISKSKKDYKSKILEEKNVLLTLAYVRVRELNAEIDRVNVLLDTMKKEPLEDEIRRVRKDIEMKMNLSSSRAIEFARLKMKTTEIIEEKMLKLRKTQVLTDSLKQQNNMLIQSLQQFEDIYGKRSFFSLITSCFCCKRNKL